MIVLFAPYRDHCKTIAFADGCSRSNCFFKIIDCNQWFERFYIFQYSTLSFNYSTVHTYILCVSTN
jgi:hypothetical protein